MAVFSKLRIRLTVWYVGIFGAVLFAFICVASAFITFIFMTSFTTQKYRTWKPSRACCTSAPRPPPPEGRLLHQPGTRMLLDRLWRS